MEKSKKIKKNIMIKNVKTSDSEAFKLLYSFYMAGGLEKPHLEFEQVSKGVFKSKNLKNIHLEISNESFSDEKGYIKEGSVIDIIDLNTNTKVKSKFLKSFKEILYIDKKNYDNNKEKIFRKNLKLEDFQYKNIDRDFYAPNNYTFLIDFYLSAKFKVSENEDFEFRFSFYKNSIIFMEPICTRFSIDEANDDELAKLLYDFEQNYFDKHKRRLNLYENPYLNFF